MGSFKILIAGVVVLMGAECVWAHAYGKMPATRAMADARVFIEQHPEVAEGYFFRGVVYGSVWARGVSKEIDMNSAMEKQPPRIVPWVSILFKRDGAEVVTPEGLKCLGECIMNYRTAAGMEAGNARFQLALAWGFEQAAAVKLNPEEVAQEGAQKLSDEEHKQCEAALVLLGSTETKKQEEGAKVLGGLLPRSAGVLSEARKAKAEMAGRVDAILGNYWMKLAVEQYRTAYELTVEKELKAKEYDWEADHSTGMRAGEQLIALLPGSGIAKAGEVEQITEAVKQIKSKPWIMVNH